MTDRDLLFQREYTFTETAGSTSEELKEAVRAASSPLWRVLSAERQTAGRGREGKTFFSPPGGIYFSATFPMEKTQPLLPCFTLLAGLTVCRALEGISPLAIKWPNDVMLNGKKVCGILAQTVYIGNAPTVILGVGINASLPEADIPPALRDIMTSFTAEGLPAPPVKKTVKDIVSALDREIYLNGALSGDFSPYLKEIAARDHLFGKRVARTLPRGRVTGVAAGLSPTGGLLIRTDAGETEEILFGAVN